MEQNFRVGDLVVFDLPFSGADFLKQFLIIGVCKYIDRGKHAPMNRRYGVYLVDDKDVLDIVFICIGDDGLIFTITEFLLERPTHGWMPRVVSRMEDD